MLGVGKKFKVVGIFNRHLLGLLCDFVLLMEVLQTCIMAAI